MAELTGDNFYDTSLTFDNTSKRGFYDRDVGDGVDVSLKEDLRLKVISYRNTRYRLFKAKYIELLSNIRNYTNLPPSINKYKLEYLLRNNYDVAIGKNSKGFTNILGVINSDYSVTGPENILSYPLTGNAIDWRIPEHLRPTFKGDFYEITELDDGNSGDFVILRNKSIRNVNDYELIELSARNVAELEASRYSLLIQSKVSTVFVGEEDDESVTQAIAQLWNGAPFMQTDNSYDLKNNMLEIGSTNTGRMKELKEVYNDIIEELNNNLGINSVGINKLSGVSDTEVNSNNGYVQNNANIYINGIEEPFKLYNKRFGTNFHVYINNQAQTDVNYELNKQGGEDE